MLFLLIHMPNPPVRYLSLLIISAVSKASHSQPGLKNQSASFLEPKLKKKTQQNLKVYDKYTLIYCIESQGDILVKVM